jgi:hypothetical protein
MLKKVALSFFLDCCNISQAFEVNLSGTNAGGEREWHQVLPENGTLPL